MERAIVLLFTANVIASASTLTQEEWTRISHKVAPALRDLISAGSKHCETLKQMFGLTYEQMKGRNAPNAEQIHIEFITENKTERHNITEDLSNIRLDDQAIVVIIHGFMESSRGEMVKQLSDAFLKKEGFTILALDGSQLLKVLYFRSTSYVRFIGEELGRFLADLDKDNKLSPDRVHLIGHSLGAHIAGVAGKEFYRLRGARLSRITALDPAGPCFDTEAEWAVRRGNAAFVDVIHTDAGFLGITERIGDQDYYPNGGRLQPGCSLPVCSHSRAWMLFAESVTTTDAFLARQCRDWEAYERDDCSSVTAYMGLAAAGAPSGTYYLRTAGHSPYGQEEVRVIE